MLCDDGSGFFFDMQVEGDEHANLKWGAHGDDGVAGSGTYNGIFWAVRDRAGTNSSAAVPLTLDDFEVVDWVWSFNQYLNYENLK